MANNFQDKRLMDIFIQRPVIALVLSIVICMAGVWATKTISVLQFPKIESSSLVITTAYTGASADVVKGFVTEPIERVAATVPGVEYVESNTTPGFSTVTAKLKLNEDSTRALAELTSRISQIRYELPTRAENPVVNVSRADRAFAAFYLNVESQNVSMSELTDYLTREVNPIINNIPGVQKVGIEGSRTPAMRIKLDAEKMSIFNLSADEVFSSLAANNTISTLGYTENSRQRVDLVANTQLSTAAEFSQLIVKNVDNTNIYLKDVAEITLDSEEAAVTARTGQKDTVYISVWPQPGSNEIEIGDRLYEVIDEINSALPLGMEIQFAYDGTLYMRDALKEIITTLFETVVLVGIVVLMMMGSFRTAFVPLITIPISILGAIAAMSLMGFSLNLLTVLAIVLSVGLVVDDAIVVVENVARHMRTGMPRIQAALLSSRQLLVPIIAMTLTLAMVYAPIGFLTGLTGVLFKEFAFTLAIAVIISGVVAITLSPIMSAYVSPEGGKEGFLTRKVNHVFDKVQRRYENILSGAFAWQYQLITAAVIIALLVIPFFQNSKKELAPMEDQSMIIMIAQSPPDASLNYAEENMRPVIDSLDGIQEKDAIWQIIMKSGGFGGINVVPPEERDKSIQQLLGESFGILMQSPGLRIFPILPQPLPTAGQFDVELIVKSTDDYPTMKNYADQIVGAAFGSGKFLFADTNLKVDLPQIELKLDRQKIADLGLNISAVSEQLNIYLSTNFVNRFDANGRAYRVIPIVGDDIRSSPESLLALQVKSSSGELIPVGSFTEIEWITVPRELGTFGQQNAFRVYGGIAPGMSKEEALASLEQAALDILPSNYTLDYAGESRQLRTEGNSLMSVLGVSLFIVYLVLAVQFNSFRDPLVVILGSVPLALSGALLLPYIELTTINIYSQIGLITLIGLIAKNGILIVEFANHVQEQGKSRILAAQEAASTRLRPILMTTGATVLGHFPLVLVTGAGAEARNSIGIILVAGMLIGTLFTLFILPIIYGWLAEDRNQSTNNKIAQNDEVKTPISLAG